MLVHALDDVVDTEANETVDEILFHIFPVFSVLVRNTFLCTSLSGASFQGLRYLLPGHNKQKGKGESVSVLTGSV
jgi:hypothetical protein